MTLTSTDLKKIVAEARPLIERQLELAEQVAGLREVVTAHGGDWSQLKALVKAQIQDERDEAGERKRVRRILDKADYANAYADMLGLNMNEKNSISSPVNDSGQGEADGAFRPGNRHSVPSAQNTAQQPSEYAANGGDRAHSNPGGENENAAHRSVNNDRRLQLTDADGHQRSQECATNHAPVESAADEISAPISQPVSVSPAADARDLGGVASSSKPTQVAPPNVAHGQPPETAA